MELKLALWTLSILAGVTTFWVVMTAGKAVGVGEWKKPRAKGGKADWSEYER